MATVIINIPDDKIGEIRDAFAWYVVKPDGITKAQHMKEEIRLWTKSIYKAYRVWKQKQDLTNATQAQIDALDANAEAESQTITTI